MFAVVIILLQGWPFYEIYGLWQAQQSLLATVGIAVLLGGVTAIVSWSIRASYSWLTVYTILFLFHVVVGYALSVLGRGLL